MHKSTGDKIGIPDSWIIYWLGDAVTHVVPLGRHANTGPILLQKYPSIKRCTQSQLNCHIKLWDMSNMFCTFMCTHEYLIKLCGVPLRQYRGCLLSGITASPSQYMTQLYIRDPYLVSCTFMHVCDPYIPHF